MLQVLQSETVRDELYQKEIIMTLEYHFNDSLKYFEILYIGGSI